MIPPDEGEVPINSAVCSFGGKLCWKISPVFQNFPNPEFHVFAGIRATRSCWRNPYNRVTILLTRSLLCSTSLRFGDLPNQPVRKARAVRDSKPGHCCRETMSCRPIGLVYQKVLAAVSKGNKRSIQAGRNGAQPRAKRLATQRLHEMPRSRTHERN